MGSGAVAHAMAIPVEQFCQALEGDAVIFPAIAIPVESKLDFECPPAHLKALEHTGASSRAFYSFRRRVTPSVGFRPKPSRSVAISWRRAGSCWVAWATRSRCRSS